MEGFEMRKGKDVKKADKERNIDCVIPHHIAGLIVYYAEEKEEKHPEHCHPDGFEILYLLEGEIDYFIDNKKMGTLSEIGDMICFFPGTYHSVEIKKKTKVIVIRNTNNRKV